MLSIYGSQPSGGKGNADWTFPLELSGVVDSFDASLASSLDISDTDKVDAWRSKKNEYEMSSFGSARPAFAGTGTTRRVVFASDGGATISLSGYDSEGGSEDEPLTETARAIIAVVSEVSGVEGEASNNFSFVQGGCFGAEPFVGTVNFAGTLDAQAKTFVFADAFSAVGVSNTGVDGTVEADDAFTGFSPYPDDEPARIIYFDTDAAFPVDTIGGVLEPGPTVSIHEIIFCDAVPSETVRQKLEGYLAWKWGLTANLPVDHPYKAAAPTS